MIRLAWSVWWIAQHFRLDATSLKSKRVLDENTPGNGGSAPKVPSMELTTVTFPSLNSSADTNGTSAQRPSPHSQYVSVVIILVVTVIILVTIVGNVLVVVAVFTSRALRAPQNLFLVSLASADILVATLVIPFSLANEVMGYWNFGSTWCAFYLALDVLFCTSSIVHLCAISLDRYWSVTKAVSYNLKRTPRRIKFMIMVVWVISAVISFPPLLMTKHDELECLLNNETWYIISSCMVSFFCALYNYDFGILQDLQGG